MSLKLIKAEKMTKEIKGDLVLSDISFEIQAGEICAVIGKNGAGKTTLFKLMTGQSTPTDGQVSYMYTDYGEKPSIGTLIERPNFFNNLSAFDNLKYFSIQKGKSSDAEIKNMLQMVGLPNNSKHFSSFSLGMKQRLGIALALIFRPEILILDEPVNGLDPEGIRDIRKILLKINRDYGTTILISSHILTELEEVSDSYIFIDKGIFLEKVTKKELQKKLKNYLMFKVNDILQAVTILDTHFPEIEYSILDNQMIRISECLELSMVINKKLVNNNISVLGIETQKTTLEDYFFEVISRGAQYE